MITLRPPLTNVGSSVWVSAATWNSGALTSATSSAARSMPIIRLNVFHSRLAWVSTAPLGLPVVPEV